MAFAAETLLSIIPIRDHKVVLHVRRRRWLDANGRDVILPHESLTAPGTSYSKEFADVLKKNIWIPSRYRPALWSGTLR